MLADTAGGGPTSEEERVGAVEAGTEAINGAVVAAFDGADERPRILRERLRGRGVAAVDNRSGGVGRGARTLDDAFEFCCCVLW